MPLPPFANGVDVRAWMQSVEDRLSRLEGRRSVVVGGWVLAERDGKVTATNTGSHEVVVLTP